MTNPSVAYFFKRFYQNIIKWWFVVYNPIARRIWPTKAEEEQALEQERLEKENEPEEEIQEESVVATPVMMQSAPQPTPASIINDATYNATTGAYSGLYGQQPVDSGTQNVLDEILNKNNSQNYIDNYIQDSVADAVPVPEDQEAIVAEANAIYERLLREAAEDEAKKQAEIDAALAAQDS